MRVATPISHDELADRSECYIRKWAAALECRTREQGQSKTCALGELIHPYVAISAEAGIEDEHLAIGLARQFGWECIGTSLVDYIAEHYDWEEVGPDYANESATAWFWTTFGTLCAPPAATNPDEFKRPGPLFYLAAHCGSCVFVDPLASFYLPAECGLSVRLIAPKEQRLATVGGLRSCSPKQTAAALASHDRADADDVKRNFHKTIGDPHLYDLVINLAHISIDSAIDLILGAYLLRFQPARLVRPFEVKSYHGRQRV